MFQNKESEKSSEANRNVKYFYVQCPGFGDIFKWLQIAKLKYNQNPSMTWFNFLTCYTHSESIYPVTLLI